MVSVDVSVLPSGVIFAGENEHVGAGAGPITRQDSCTEEEIRSPV